MARLKQIWCADVIRPNGRVVKYRLTRDLQHALNSDSRGRNEMQNALIVIPLAPYLRTEKSKSVDDRKRLLQTSQPPFGIGLVRRIYRLSSGQARYFQVTRSQFIGHQYWTVRPFKSCNSYLRHDYPWLSQKQIAADITYWQNQLFKRNTRQNWFWKWVSSYRVKHQLKKIRYSQYLSDLKNWKV
ncbi:DUF7679 family protein [Lentilactobacillus hilgardii]|jgi:hypothetical protein|uniref:DUF7679 family protein n=1 Tax=Lentilactobacillus hilgardii TaxID=1588 RepID=UPI00019C53DF|nr:hypothetical protein [Lentilactobacillus hilgardii]EEI70782.1 hypothetical protein HMPREF0496_1954 [Lentilactobacillus hilgardii ATCC 27305]MCT3390529.1 hypothetical protein [Lentilactobacillus hilgardii]RRG12669.1 MAG: hypothetical protein DUD35_01230 [Lactobacillus sp.]